MTALAPILQGYFTDRLAALQASPETIRSYRDTYRLLLTYLHTTTGTPPSRLDLSDLHPQVILSFLDHLQASRGNGVATRNLRLTAIHSLFGYAALRCPEHADLIARVLAIPNKRPTHRIVSYLTRRETVALLTAPDQKTPLGRRDHLLLTVAVQSGLRISGTDRAGLRRPHRRRRRAPALHRQGPQSPDHPADPTHRRRAAPLDRPSRRGAH